MKLTKKVSLLFFVLLLVFSLTIATGCGGGGAPADKNEVTEKPDATTEQPKELEPYKIGAIFDITGPGSSLGVPERDSANMLV